MDDILSETRWFDFICKLEHVTRILAIRGTRNFVYWNVLVVRHWVRQLTSPDRWFRHLVDVLKELILRESSASSLPGVPEGCLCAPYESRRARDISDSWCCINISQWSCNVYESLAMAAGAGAAGKAGWEDDDRFDSGLWHLFTCRECIRVLLSAQWLVNICVYDANG